MATNLRKANEAKQAAQELGDSGEELVARWYQSAGYTILARNWKCFEGELDIVARRGRTTVICEVKTRSNRFMDPATSISASKQAKVRTAAHRWLTQNGSTGRLRCDVALVVNGRLQLIEGAF